MGPISLSGWTLIEPINDPLSQQWGLYYLERKWLVLGFGKSLIIHSRPFYAYFPSYYAVWVGIVAPHYDSWICCENALIVLRERREESMNSVS